MDLGDFFDRIEAHDELFGVSIDTDTGIIAVEHVPTKLCTTVPKEAVEKIEWDVLEDVLTGKREPQILFHMTRIVGYYSRVENWNNSKLGEMKDRIRGHYTLQGKQSEESVNRRISVVEEIQNS